MGFGLRVLLVFLLVCSVVCLVRSADFGSVPRHLFASVLPRASDTLDLIPYALQAEFENVDAGM
jgi:hypothetical protein